MKLIRTFCMERVDPEASSLEYDGRHWEHFNTGFYSASASGESSVCGIYEYRCTEEPARFLKVYIAGPKEGLCEEYEDDSPAPPPREPSPELELDDIHDVTKCARVLYAQVLAFSAFCEDIADGRLESALAAANDFCLADRYPGDYDNLPEWLAEDGEEPAEGWSVCALEHMRQMLRESMDQTDDAAAAALEHKSGA